MSCSFLKHYFGLAHDIQILFHFLKTFNVKFDNDIFAYSRIIFSRIGRKFTMITVIIKMQCSICIVDSNTFVVKLLQLFISRLFY